MRSKQNQHGFTLIESIVAAAIFAVAMVSIVGIYLSTVRISRRTDLVRTASENVRYISEYLSKEIRNGQIDYYGPAMSPCSVAPAIVSPSNSLQIVNVDGDQLCFYLGNNAGLISASGPNLWLIKNNLPAAKVNTSSVSINTLNFYVAPTANPYLSSQRTQPRVSIQGILKANSGAQDNITMPVDISISLPLYNLQ